MGKFRRFLRTFLRSSPQVGTQNGSPSSPGSAHQGSQVIVVISPSNEELSVPLSQAESSQRLPSSVEGNSPAHARRSVSSDLQTPLANDVIQGQSNLRHQGLFQNASNFSISHSTMIEHTEVHSQTSSVFKTMRLKHVILGAEFDSSDRDYPPRCHPATRVRFLDELQTHIHSGTRIVWIRGPAGIGKSAIMQTLAETIYPDFTCTTLFLSRPNKRDDPKKVFSTLAYRLMVDNPSYRQYLGEKMAIDSGFLDKSIEEQFKRLFTTPFTSDRIDTGTLPWVVLIDGLDECNGEQEQSRIVNAIRDSILRYANSMPFVWVIASRPEAHLNAPFAQVETQISAFWKLEIPIDSDEASQDVERYIRVAFTEIRQNYSDVVPRHWPSEIDLLKLAKTSSGLFVFASTSVAYIAEDNPVLRFEHILSLTTQHNTSSDTGSPAPTKNPFEMLDLLYTTIMSGIPTDFLPTTKAILGFYLLGDLVTEPTGFRMTPRDPSLLATCNILGLKQHMAYAALRRLNSVLTYPPQDAPNDTVQFLHASFSDFLKDRSRSQSYHIDLNQELWKIWRCYVRITTQSITSLGTPLLSFKYVWSDIYEGEVTLSWERETAEDNDELRRQVLERAEHKWLEMLVDCRHTDRAPSPCEDYQLLPNTFELTGMFQNIRPILFRPRNPDIRGFHSWLSNHASLEFRQQMILKEFNASQVDESEADTIFDGLWTQRWGYYSETGYSAGRLKRIDLTDLDRPQWNQIKETAHVTDAEWSRGILNWKILGGLLKGRMDETTLITVIGMQPSDYFAVVRVADNEETRTNKEVSYLVVPYGPVSTKGCEPSTLQH